MNPEQTRAYNRAYNRAKTQRRRAAEALGLTHVRLWVHKEGMEHVHILREATEAMIDEALASKHGDK